MRALNKLFFAFAAIFFSIPTLAEFPNKAWKTPSDIINGIQLPQIPPQAFTITDFGAKPNTDARPAILKAIEAATANGGGIVIIPKGEWQSHGPIHLKSKINLQVSEGALLVFSGNPTHYLPAVKVRWEGTEVLTYSPLIYAANVHDVAITGKGIIDGNSKSEFKTWHKKQDPSIDKLRNMGFNGVPVEKRLFTEGTYLRPGLIQFFHADRVLLENYTSKNSPFWVNHLVYTNHATVRNLNVDSHFPNNDGIDIESSSNVLVENCLFRTGDDSVVIKSGRDLDGRTIGIPSKDIVVRNNDMGGEDGIGLGSEMSGGISNVYFLDNILREGDSAFRFKSNLDRGGLVEHIVIENCKVESFTNLFWFQLDYPSKLGGNFPATYRDIEFKNITAKNIKNFLEIHAPAASPVKNVKFTNINVENVENVFNIENAVDLIFSSVKIGKQTIDGKLDWVE